MTNSKIFGRYVVLHFVYVYQISRCHITKGDHSTVHIILKRPDLPLLFYCLIPMKYIMNNSAYSEHMAKCPSYELLPHWNPLQKCVNKGKLRIKSIFNACQISKLESFFIWKVAWIKIYVYADIHNSKPLGRLTPQHHKTDTPTP